MLTTVLAAVLYLHIHGASEHFGSAEPYNERNGGLGARYSSWSLDAFRDSHGNTAGLVGYVRERELPWAAPGELYFGTTLGYLYHTNYRGLAPVPQLRWQGEHIGLRFVFSPLKDGYAVVGVSLVLPLKR